MNSSSALNKNTIRINHDNEIKDDIQNDHKKRTVKKPLELSWKCKKSQTSQTLKKNTEDFKPRDPRFDPVCGDFNKNLFRKNYAFIQELRFTELNKLNKQLRQTTNLDRRKFVKQKILRLRNQLRDQNQERKKVNIEEKIENLMKKFHKSKKTRKLERDLKKKYQQLNKKN